jgi:hypothetical protein
MSFTRWAICPKNLQPTPTGNQLQIVNKFLFFLIFFRRKKILLERILMFFFSYQWLRFYGFFFIIQVCNFYQVIAVYLQKENVDFLKKKN